MLKVKRTPRILFSKQKIGCRYIVCFDNSNLFVQFEKPAYFVFKSYAQGYSISEIETKFIAKFGFERTDVEQFVNQIAEEAERMLLLVLNENRPTKLLPKIPRKESQNYSVFCYRYGNCLFSFTYETKLLEFYIHPLIAHLEVNMCEVAQVNFELFSIDNLIHFYTNGVFNGKWSHEQTNRFKGKVFQEIINAIYVKTDNDWLMSLHASAITNGRNTILLSAAPGSGKSTLAAMLLSRGYKLVSDDFVPVDREHFLAHPFPIAMSVKEGSVGLLTPHFLSLKLKPITVVSPEKNVRFLSSEIQFAANHEMFPVRNIIFVSYSKDVDFKLKKLNRSDALNAVFEQSWIAPTNGNAALFFKWFLQTSFYSLNYSNNQKALDAVSEILECKGLL